MPGLGYLEKYTEFIIKSQEGTLTPAELAFLIDKLDPAHLHWLEQAREHGVDLLKKWLVQYKFKDWDRTEKRGVEVTDLEKTERAKEIAEKLNDTKAWRSHGRGLSISVIREKLNLRVEDYGVEERHVSLKKAMESYYGLLKDYMGRRGFNFAVQTRESRFVG